MSSADAHRFEREINLIALAEQYGYASVPRESTRSTVVMRHNLSDAHLAVPGNEIIVARASTGPWVYSHIHDGHDRGTVVDFLAHRPDARSIAFTENELREPSDIRRELTQALGSGSLTEPCELKPLDSPHRLELARAVQAAAKVDRHPYLDHLRIHPDTQCDPKFKDTFRRLPNGDLIFPHRDEDGITGYEQRRLGAEPSVAMQGTKALWCSTPAANERILVVTENPIVAMSYHQLSARAPCEFSKDLMRFATVGDGPMSDRQLDLVKKALHQLPDKSLCVAAVASHERGDALWGQIAGIGSGARNHRFIRDSPPLARDWNELVRRPPDQVLSLRANLSRRAHPERGL